MEDSILHRAFHRQHHNLNMEQWIKNNVPSLTDLLKRGRAVVRIGSRLIEWRC